MAGIVNNVHLSICTRVHQWKINPNHQLTWPRGIWTAAWDLCCCCWSCRSCHCVGVIPCCCAAAANPCCWAEAWLACRRWRSWDEIPAWLVSICWTWESCSGKTCCCVCCCCCCCCCCACWSCNRRIQIVVQSYDTWMLFYHRLLSH